MVNVEGLRKPLSELQNELLQQIAESYLATGKGPVCRALHSRFQRPGVVEALSALGGSVLVQTDEPQEGGCRYEPTFLGLLLSPRGTDCENLLVGLLEYEEFLFLTQPDRNYITSLETAVRLHLTVEESVQLYHLIAKAGFYSPS